MNRFYYFTSKIILFSLVTLGDCLYAQSAAADYEEFLLFKKFMYCKCSQVQDSDNRRACIRVKQELIQAHKEKLQGYPQCGMEFSGCGLISALIAHKIAGKLTGNDSTHAALTFLGSAFGAIAGLKYYIYKVNNKLSKLDQQQEFYTQCAENEDAVSRMSKEDVHAVEYIGEIHPAILHRMEEYFIMQTNQEPHLPVNPEARYSLPLFLIQRYL